LIFNKINKLELRYYIQNGAIVDATISTPQALLDRITYDKLFADTVFIKLESEIPFRNFFEFFIDDVALSKRLNEHYNINLLNSWMGTLEGMSVTADWDKMKALQLLLKRMPTEQIKAFLSNSCTDDNMDDFIDDYESSLSTQFIILYGCFCGDFRCSGLSKQTIAIFGVLNIQQVY
jgi:hypothetical protein